MSETLRRVPFQQPTAGGHAAVGRPDATQCRIVCAGGARVHGFHKDLGDN